MGLARKSAKWLVERPIVAGIYPDWLDGGEYE